MEDEEPVNILVVDDQPVNLRVAEGLLAPLGQNVVTAESGPDALRHVLDADFACILLDVKMPGMDGFETARLIRERERSRQTPIVFVTASDQDLQEARKGYACGAVDYLFKPVVPEILQAKVTQFVDMARKDRQLKQQAEQLRQQCDLLASERQMLLARMERFFTLTDDLISIKRRDGKRLYVNAAYCRLTGMTEEELLEQPWLAVVHPDDRAATVTTLEQDQADRQLVNRIRASDGSYRHVAWKWVRDPESGLSYGAGRDITRQLELQRQLTQSQKMEAVGQLAGGVAHDFNNLLTVVLGNCDFLAGVLPADGPPREWLDAVVKAGTSAATLSRQLLAFSRQGVAEYRTWDLNALVGEMLKLLGRLLGPNIEQAVELGREAPAVVKVDAGQIQQVVMNLAVNARDAMSQNGKLTIRTGREILPDSCALHPQHATRVECVTLEVSDTGCGMDANTLGHMFEPFFTTKEPGQGTGLGLSTVFGIVSQHRGHLTVQSELARGTTFKLYLPPAGPTAASSETRPSPLPGPGRGETVLLVEDQELVRELAVRILRKGQYTVLTAGDGAEALELLARQEGPLHLLLTDLVMPGIDGFELAKQVAARHPETKILFISGYSRAAPEFPLQLPANAQLLQKPFGPEQLTSKVREVLDG